MTVPLEVSIRIIAKVGTSKIKCSQSIKLITSNTEVTKLELTSILHDVINKSS